MEAKIKTLDLGFGEANFTLQLLGPIYDDNFVVD